MGKSSKKSVSKVDAAPAVVPPIKSVKRESEVQLSKQVTAKKQKRDENAEHIAQKKKIAAKNQTIKEESSDDSSSKSEKLAAKKIVASKKKPASAPPPKGKSDSVSNSSSDDDSDEKTKKVPALSTNNGSVPQKKMDESSDSSESEGDNGLKKSTTVSQKMPAKKVESTDDDSSSDDDDGKAKLAKNGPSLTPKNKAESSESLNSDDSSNEDSEEDIKAPAQAKTGAIAPKTTIVASKRKSESSDNESSDDESSDDEAMKDSKKGSGDSKESYEDEDTPSKLAKNALKTAATPKVESSSTTLFVGNLSFSVSEDDVVNLFEDAGEVVNVRLAKGKDGRFRGFGHVEFANTEAVKKALTLNGKELLGRPVKLDLAVERGAYTPNSSNNGNSLQKGQAHTVFVRGFDTSLEVEETRSSLREFFSSCGEINRISVPKDFDSGEIKGFAYVDFNDTDSFNQALELNGSDLGGCSIHVDEAKPRGDSQSGGGRGGFGRSGGRGGFGRSGGRGGFGRSGGRGGFGRSGGRGNDKGGGGRFSGGRSGRGGRGRGAR